MRHSLVFLIGYRGAGKTAVAKLLAEKLGWQWLDADAVLEQRCNRTIRQIFADEGEAYFRDAEATVLQDLCCLQNHVIATGGGIILRPENRERLRKGTVVWLRAEPSILWQRLQQDTTTIQRRPNLTQGGIAEIEELLRVRSPIYDACQDFTVDTGSKSPEQVAQRIFDWLRDHSENQAEMTNSA